jgi:GxxExxY protein
MNQEILGKAVLDAAFRVHTVLGPGLLESVYEAALTRELTKRGHRVERQKPISVSYEGELLDDIGFRADLIVDELVLVELKSVSEISEVFKKTTLSYLRFIPLHLGFLINFNEAHLKNGITRIVNGTEGKPFFSSPSPPSPLRETPL